MGLAVWRDGVRSAPLRVAAKRRRRAKMDLTGNVNRDTALELATNDELGHRFEGFPCGGGWEDLEMVDGGANVVSGGG